MTLSHARRAFVRAYAESVLQQTGGCITEAAKKMGLTTRSLYRMLRRFGLSHRSCASHETARSRIASDDNG